MFVIQNSLIYFFNLKKYNIIYSVNAHKYLEQNHFFCKKYIISNIHKWKRTMMF